MKKIFLAIAIILLSQQCFSQELFNNTWCFGDSSMFRFDNGIFDSSTPSSIVAIEGSASISDSLGNLLFYSNGVKIWNRNHVTMPNSDSIYAGTVMASSGSSTTQGVILLKKPDSFNQYYAFILLPQLSVPSLHYCLIDMNLDNGLGDVVLKNQFIYTDTLMEKMDAVKHANGRDWWLYVHKARGNEFVRFLITPSGIQGPFYQAIGPIPAFGSGVGQMAISPDGSKVAMTFFKSVVVYDLNRCTGELSNAKKIVQYSLLDSHEYGCCFSPSNQYLYLSKWDSLLQIDLTIEDPYQNRYLVYYEPFANSPFYQGLYPISVTALENLNDKIIVNIGLMATAHIDLPPYNTSLSIINQPDLYQGACDFQPFSIPLQHGHLMGGLPNMPNYNLAALSPTACDSTSAINETEIQKFNFEIFPNPNDGNFLVDASGAFSFELFDLAGKELYKKNYEESSVRVFIPEHLPNGCYLYQVTQANGFSKSGLLNLLK